MICGNDPNAQLVPGDQAAVAWFREWLRWSKLPDVERLAERAPSMPGETTCAHCGAPQRGHATVGVQRLCHPDDGPDCYRLVTVYGCTMPCSRGGHA